METLNHFSHWEHPLFLIEDVHHIAEAAEEPICYGCAKEIKSELEAEPTYCCGECSGFFLHKHCAELPRGITHPLHPKHRLVLLSQPSYRLKICECDACRQEWSRFTYHCFTCEFDICISCFLAEPKFQHPGHHHPLTLQLRQALFICDACGEEDRDQSYFCTTCCYWIHRKCALLPKKNRREDHDHNHTFSLAYNLPMEYRNYNFRCDVCHKDLDPDRWVYYCGRCRYFVHLRCFKKDIQPFGISYQTSKIGDVETDTEVTENPLQQFGAIEYLFQDPIRFPTYNFDSIIRQFVKQQGCKNEHLFSYCSLNEDDERQHLPTICSNLKSTVETMVPAQEIICDCCIQPIDLSRPFHECGQCKYFFHSNCLKLPMTIFNPFLLEHPLQLLKLAEHASALYFCQLCNQETNGACYGCERFKFYVDIKCASLPTVIKHEAHHHPLYFTESEPESCSACGDHLPFLFRCKHCKFNLDHGCAQLPQTVKHRWDKHPLTLSFPPFSDHPDEFWCAMCEQEIHPKFWLYHCRECDTSFHLGCLGRAVWGRNIKFGRNITVGNHPHPLLMTSEYSFYSSCDTCNKDLNDRNSFVCKSCKFYLCHECADKNKINFDHKFSDCSTSKNEDWNRKCMDC